MLKCCSELYKNIVVNENGKEEKPILLTRINLSNGSAKYN